jgi:hypothetical protein
MSKEKAKLVLVVDISGSMSSLATKASAGINRLIKEQSEAPGYCSLELYEFSDDVKQVYSGDIKEYTKKHGEYRLRATNSTALWDAVGISLIEQMAKTTKSNKSSRPAVKLFTLVTDGMENASKHYTNQRSLPTAVVSRVWQGQTFSPVQTNDERKLVGEVIEKAKAQGWDFTFLCNNPIVQTEGKSVGIDQTLTYATNSIDQVYAATSSKMTRMRGQSISGQKVENLYSANEIAMMSGQ